uniref:Solute carrier family 15 member 1 isoform X2 n=1 Tax=Geotrypetes seraphini TaxID=260995 RepID=A0A6P8R0K5_GEOSA|nr:solute carrier family 15 member 1 isoform X2 [Geotrypetes seraphini]
MGKEKTEHLAPTCFGYPISIFFIVINEFCERFSYYGMRAVLVLYFNYFLKWDENLSTVIYHTFVALCYLTPILGAIIADSWLGKFKTIIYLSIVYVIGQALMSISSINDITDNNRDGEPDIIEIHIALSMVALMLIALGTGGIKPCVAAFGGDQFEEHQDRQRSRFFAIFYLSINAGSLISTIVTPILKAQECGIYSKQQCYPMAFGVPAALMVVALIVFIIGSRMYKKVDPEGNIMVTFFKCIVFAIRNRFRNRSKEIPKREHWLDWGKEKYDDRLIAQIKMVLRVLVLYIPLPMFWALFDQQGSRWTLQATTMNGDFGAIQIEPEQMQTVNAILIVIMVPIVDGIVYPLIRKCKLNFTPLKRMTVGMFFAAMAFVAAALVQIKIDETLPKFPTSSQTQLKVINLDRTNLIVNFPQNITNVTIAAGKADDYKTFTTAELKNITFNNTVTSINAAEGQRQTLLFKDYNIKLVTDIRKKPAKGKNAIRFVNNLMDSINVTLDNSSEKYLSIFEISNYSEVSRGKVKIEVSFMNEFKCNVESMLFGYGSSYTIIIKQAPSNMKSVLQAGWLLTVAVGNIIVLIVAGAAQLSEQWAEYVLFASLLVAVCIIFSVMAHFYTYVDPVEIEAQFDEKERKEKEMHNIYETEAGPFSQTKM